MGPARPWESRLQRRLAFAWLVFLTALNVYRAATWSLTGFVVDRTGQFFWPFAITGGVCLFGAISWVFAVGPVRQVEWRGQVPVRLLPER